MELFGKVGKIDSKSCKFDFIKLFHVHVQTQNGNLVKKKIEKASSSGRTFNHYVTIVSIKVYLPEILCDASVRKM